MEKNTKTCRTIVGIFGLALFAVTAIASKSSESSTPQDSYERGYQIGKGARQIYDAISLEEQSDSTMLDSLLNQPPTFVARR